MSSDTYLNADLPPVEAQLTEAVALMTEKAELSPEDAQLITEQVFAPLVQVFAGENPLYPYQMDVACGICYALLTAAPYTPTILQARQCLDENTVVLNEDGTASLIKNARLSWLSGKDVPVYTIETECGSIIRKVTADHIIPTPSGDKSVDSLNRGDIVYKYTGGGTWLNKAFDHTVTDHGFPVSIFATNPTVAFDFVKTHHHSYAGGYAFICENEVYANYMKALLNKLGFDADVGEDIGFYQVFTYSKPSSLDVVWNDEPTFQEVVVDYIEITGVSSTVYDKESPERGWYIADGVKVHNSGKSEAVACTVLALGVLMPQLFKLFKAKQIRRFKKGFRVGVYGPDYQKSGIIASRIKEKSRSRSATEIFQDPDLGINPNEIVGLKFPNGFSVDVRTAKKGSNIEGFTYDLIICDEAQEIDTYILNKSIRPMRTSTNGLVVLIGTPTPVPCAFQETCYRNEHQDSIENKTEKPYRRHYEYDWTYCASQNENYREAVKGEMLTIGRHSDEFKLAYDLEWLDTKGRFFTRGDLLANAIQEPTEFEDYQERTKVTFKCPAALVSSDIHTPHQVFSIDFAKSGDTTVVTIARVWWDNPIEQGRENRYHVHIENWAEFSGDHEKQFPEILDFIEKYNVSLGVGDATGMGDPIISRLNAELLRRRAKKGEGYIEIHPFVFSQPSKHEGYSLLKQEWLAARVTYPASPHTQQTKKYKRFVKEMRELIKEYKGNYMSVHHPPGKDYHDDYPDALMMLVWVVNKHGLHTSLATMKENPRYSAMQERIAQRKKTQSFSGLSKPKQRFWR